MQNVKLRKSSARRMVELPFSVAVLLRRMNLNFDIWFLIFDLGFAVFVAYARGGEYPPGTGKEAFDLQKKYLELILGFMGFSNVCSVVVGPTLAGGPDIAKQKRTEAIEKARQVAKEF